MNKKLIPFYTNGTTSATGYAIEQIPIPENCILRSFDGWVTTGSDHGGYRLHVNVIRNGLARSLYFRGSPVGKEIKLYSGDIFEIRFYSCYASVQYQAYGDFEVS